MTEQVFSEDAYARSCEAQVTQSAPGAIQLDRTVFYAAGGGQPGDSGVLKLADGMEIPVLNTVKGEAAGEILHLVAEDAPLPAPGTAPPLWPTFRSAPPSSSGTRPRGRSTNRGGSRTPSDARPRRAS